MRFPASIGAFITFVLGPILLAQEPALPKPETPDSSAAQSPTPASPSPPPQLFPPDVLSAAERGAAPVATAPGGIAIPQLDESFKQNSVSAATENARKHEEWRKLRNRIANDGEVKAALYEVEKARTDLEKRKLLRAYYEVYFAKLTALAPTPEMKAYLADRKNEKLGTLPQPRVRPTPTPSKTSR